MSAASTVTLYGTVRIAVASSGVMLVAGNDHLIRMGRNPPRPVTCPHALQRQEQLHGSGITFTPQQRERQAARSSSGSAGGDDGTARNVFCFRSLFLGVGILSACLNPTRAQAWTSEP